MQVHYKRSSVIGCFSLLVAILIGNSIIIKRQLDAQVNSALWVIHSGQVLFELSQTESLLKEAAGGRSGFLQTSKEEDLAAYNLAVAKLETHIDTLVKLTGDNPRQQALIVQLRAKLADLAQAIAFHRSGRQEDARKPVHADSDPVAMNNIRETISQMEDEESALEVSRIAEYRKSIRLTTIGIFLTTVLAAAGLILLAYYIIHEINLREKYATEVQAREELFRVTLTSIGDAVIATDKDAKVTFLNPVAEDLLGIKSSAAIGKNVADVFPIFSETTLAPLENPVARVIQSGRAMGLADQTVLRRPDGSHTLIDDSAAPIRNDSGQLIGVVLVFRDVTTLRKTQEVLRNTEKLSAAARLSATVAHEINNPLEAVVNLIYLSRVEPGLAPRVATLLEQCEQELDRVAHITRQTLGFYRDSNEAQPVQLELLIESVFRLYSNKLKSKHIHIERRFGKCPRILGVIGELKQVISNLISNACDAVAQNGTIIVDLECIERPGSAIVQMVIEDNGPGVAKGLEDRIFEPFFTTKQDVGTGLGLWVTQEIVERHGGTIKFSPRKDGMPGAAFTVVFPALVDDLNKEETK